MTDNAVIAADQTMHRISSAGRNHCMVFGKQRVRNRREPADRASIEPFERNGEFLVR